MTEFNYAKTESIESNDVSYHLAEIKESYERKIDDLQSDFSQQKGLMMAVLEKSSNKR